jgi:hypothetical protein
MFIQPSATVAMARFIRIVVLKRFHDGFSIMASWSVRSVVASTSAPAIPTYSSARAEQPERVKKADAGVSERIAKTLGGNPSTVCIAKSQRHCVADCIIAFPCVQE